MISYYVLTIQQSTQILSYHMLHCNKNSTIISPSRRAINLAALWTCEHQRQRIRVLAVIEAVFPSINGKKYKYMRWSVGGANSIWRNFEYLMNAESLEHLYRRHRCQKAVKWVLQSPSASSDMRNFELEGRLRQSWHVPLEMENPRSGEKSSTMLQITLCYRHPVRISPFQGIKFCLRVSSSDTRPASLASICIANSWIQFLCLCLSTLCVCILCSLMVSKRAYVRYRNLLHF